MEAELSRADLSLQKKNQKVENEVKKGRRDSQLLLTLIVIIPLILCAEYN